MSLETENQSSRPVVSDLDSPIIDRYIIRRISGFITGLIVKTPVTPNQVTILSLVTGITAALFFSHGSRIYTIIAGILYFVSTIFDQCDGEVARFKHMESEFGRAFDIIVDSIVNAGIVAGITVALYKNSGSGFHIIIGVMAITGISISILLATYFGKENKTDTGTKEMLDKLNNKDFFYIIMLASVFFNQMIWFLLIMAVGTNIFWIVHKIAHRKVTT
ncbi:phosphatidylglycerophosphate synthase [Candidatus Scalindua japonica]|uniref:Phosphatidylglycerophosphate synthase n=1 Tax=Candidatus Scalindua japonica TaxID=1284222 RepID=A0A286TYF8_9BACT|nr:CDP-alcohol phosphatidyltransferase family protein [Candidatus Scalindua japonica]GAX60898.1 phosphatidylglycerophosphate synthase [Candidatus Scalindua japonica]